MSEALDGFAGPWHRWITIPAKVDHTLPAAKGNPPPSSLPPQPASATGALEVQQYLALDRATALPVGSGTVQTGHSAS